MKKEAKILIDFDDVIFNTFRFVEDYKKIFRRNGISGEEFEKNYYGHPVKGKGKKPKKYDPETHIRTFRNRPGTDIGKLKEDIKGFVEGSGKYIFRDARIFLSRIKKKNIFLISYGDSRFQRRKIACSGIAPCFKKIIIFDKLKSSGAGRLVRENRIGKKCPVFFLDDRIGQIDDVKKKYPWITTVFVRRKEGRYRDKKTGHADFSAKDLGEAERIIEKIICDK